MARTIRIFAVLATLVSALTVLLATNPARGQLGGEPDEEITAERVTFEAPKDESPSVKAEQSVEAPSSQGKALPERADGAVVDVHMQECGAGRGAEIRLGMMEHTSMHDHCVR